MRPYCTILRDSFHEALVSRVLWIVLLLIALVLAALAPIGTADKIGSHLNDDAIFDANSLLQQMKGESAKGGASPGARIWSRLDGELRKRFENPGQRPDSPRNQWDLTVRLRRDLNRLLEERDFYDDQAWQKRPVRREARELLGKGLDTLAPEELARFNRLALEAAYPGQIAAVGRKQVQLTYAGWEAYFLPPMDSSTFRFALNAVLHGFMFLLLGVGGILVAIVVTSPIIPHTFEPGAIDLLLSKPVSRSLVFLTKFLGGCAFTTVNAAFMIGGLWLILGLRLGVWYPNLIWCIPLYLFLFAIYYAVSGLAGLLWRNAIVSVVMAGVFWAICFGLGLAREALDRLLMSPQRLVQLVPADESLLAVNQQGQFVRWDESQRQWLEVLSSGSPQRVQFTGIPSSTRISPLYDTRTKRLFTIINPSNGNPLWIGREDQDWRRISGASLPSAAESLFLEDDGSLLAVSTLGVFRMQGDAEAKPKTAEILGFKIPLKDNGGRFVEAGPELNLFNPLSAAFNQDRNELALFDGRKLLILERGKSEAYRERKSLKFDPAESGLVAFSGAVLVLALESGEIRIYDGADLNLNSTIQPASKSPPRMAIASPDGRWFAVAFHDGRLWVYDAQRHAVCQTPLSGPGSISSVAFNDSNQLLVADRFTRVTEYDPANWQVVVQHEPTLAVMEGVYRYIIDPLYKVLPKPGDLNELVIYILTDETSLPIGRPTRDLRAARDTIDVPGILWSNLAFLAIVLGIGCVYVTRRDF